MMIPLQTIAEAGESRHDEHDHGEEDCDCSGIHENGCRLSGTAKLETKTSDLSILPKSSKVLFVLPPSVGDYFSAQVPHIGVAYLIAVLKKNSIDVKLMDMRLGYHIEDVLKLIDDYKPDIVGFSCFSLGFGEAKPVIKAVKEHSNNYKVIVGGPHVSAVRKKVLKDTVADMAVFGEGEITLVEICEGGKSVSEINGLVYRNGDEIIENMPQHYIEDLDSLPFPDYSLFEIEKYLCYPEKHIPIVTSRGCPYQCTYCSVRLSMGMQFRSRSPDGVVEEFERLYNEGWVSFEIHDDNFTLNLDRAAKICDALIKRNLKITWKIDNGIRADRVTKELFEKMKRAGCIFLAFGVESGRQNVLNAMRKSLEVGKVVTAAQWAREVGIQTGATFIIGHPEETYEDFLESLKFAETIPVDQIIFYNIVPYPGTELYGIIEKMVAKGEAKWLMDKEKFLEQVAHWKNRPIFETDTFSEEERVKAYKKAYRIHRKKILEFKLGKKLGTVAWIASNIGPVDRMGHKLFLTPGIGRDIFNKIKKA